MCLGVRLLWSMLLLVVMIFIFRLERQVWSSLVCRNMFLFCLSMMWFISRVMIMLGLLGQVFVILVMVCSVIFYFFGFCCVVVIFMVEMMLLILCCVCLLSSQLIILCSMFLLLCRCFCRCVILVLLLMLLSSLSVLVMGCSLFSDLKCLFRVMRSFGLWLLLWQFCCGLLMVSLFLCFYLVWVCLIVGCIWIDRGWLVVSSLSRYGRLLLVI